MDDIRGAAARGEETLRPRPDHLGRPAPGRRDDIGMTPGAARTSARRLLASRATLRQAILLAEIIGPPRALRPSGR
jgi:hypothetical protein